MILFLIIAIINIASSKITDYFEESNPILALILYVIFFFVSIWMQLGLLDIVLKIHDAEEVKVGDLFMRFNLILKYSITALLYSIVVFGFLFLFVIAMLYESKSPLPYHGLFIIAGYILSLIHAVIWGIKFIFYNYEIIDKGLNPIAALKESAAITEGSQKELVLFILLTIAINLLGLLVFVVGLFITMPVSMLAIAFVYRKLSNQTPEIDIQPKL
jgi:uncharacterized membrane protein